MGSATKITLSAKELSLVTDPSWILTKQDIIEKVYRLLAPGIEMIKSELENKAIELPAAVKASVPKIYRGENYRQLPYVMLDFPRYFNGGEVFALRTMFWWGHFFSITLHLAGTPLDAYRKNIMEHLEKSKTDLFICVNEDQWEHHFETGNYKAVRHLTATETATIIQRQQFLKLALKYDLHQWNQMDVLLQDGYRQILGLLD